MKKLLFATIIINFISCDSRNTDEISTPVTYSKDVSPIINTYCVSCHSPKGGASSYYPLTSYTEVKNAIDNIIVRIEKPDSDPLKMPQGSNLTADEISLIKKWKAGGLKE